MQQKFEGNPPLGHRGTPRNKYQIYYTEHPNCDYWYQMRQKQQAQAPGSQAPRYTTWKSNEIKPLEVTENQGSQPPGRKPPSRPPPSHQKPTCRAIDHAAQTSFGQNTKISQSVPRAAEGYRLLGGRLCLHRTRDASPLLIQNKTRAISRPVLGQEEGNRTRVGRVCALGIPGWFCA